MILCFEVNILTICSFVKCLLLQKGKKTLSVAGWFFLKICKMRRKKGLIKGFSVKKQSNARKCKIEKAEC